MQQSEGTGVKQILTKTENKINEHIDDDEYAFAV